MSFQRPEVDMRPSPTLITSSWAVSHGYSARLLSASFGIDCGSYSTSPDYRTRIFLVFYPSGCGWGVRLTSQQLIRDSLKPKTLCNSAEWRHTEFPQKVLSLETEHIQNFQLNSFEFRSESHDFHLNLSQRSGLPLPSSNRIASETTEDTEQCSAEQRFSKFLMWRHDTPPFFFFGGGGVAPNLHAHPQNFYIKINIILWARIYIILNIKHQNN